MTATAPFAVRLAQARAAGGALRAELDDWAARVEKQEDWKRYRSQIGRLRAIVIVLLDNATAALTDVAEADGWRLLARGERALLAAHGIWTYFRDKYQLRDTPALGPMLRLADDFAWGCYAPVRTACAPVSGREPPLVYFSESWSPFALPRDRNFANELHFAESGTAAVLEDAAFRATLDRLPVPLVSLPWLYTGTPQGLLVIAHEVGHIVAGDFSLDAALARAIAAAPWDHGAALWQGWREELFADLFAVLAAGDGYVGALADLLAIEPDRLATEMRLGGRYPPRALRMEIALVALGPRAPAQAALLRARWEVAYPVRPDLSALTGDVARAVDLIFALDCGGRRLDSLFALDETGLLVLLRRAVTPGGLAEPFDAIAALVMAQRLADGRIPRIDVVAAQRNIIAFAGARLTGYRGTALGETVSHAADDDLGRSLWAGLADDP